MFSTKHSTFKAKCVFTSLLFLSMTSVLFSQITISQSEFMSLFTPGNSIYAIPGESGIINIGNYGGPNVYDFTHIDTLDIFAMNNYEVSQVPALASRYPNNATTFGENPQNIDGFPIFLSINDSTFLIGDAYIQNDYQFTHYVPYEKFADFPIVYGNPSVWQIIDVYDTTFNSNWQVTDTYSYSDYITVSVDGFGTLQLPDTSYECLRMRRDYTWFQYKEFMFITREGVFIVLSEVVNSLPDTGYITTDYMVLMKYNPNSIKGNKIYTPSEFRIEQNYPNPFNPTTKIDYTLSQPGFVTLTVFDYLGREIQTTGRIFQSAGIQSFIFDGSNFSSGVYFYQLIAGSELIETKKMILLK